ncbi:BZ3500_MvSof-1268-A1-R1_Chr1-3g02090 [Microbotryum saponariae]|uniref:BZ3500_MvSof-1268-A1-R1_Chr1-3g02090 protein n=1 Tax=Microbotryum saponariae TaxID=289078 RepID=A0A2X0KCI6_9BASI|nr:BZ3500_MvSof-1268-A1-R1_Chr1-3g02090 [Microbotryum saponariae]SCZ95392.1 BZ3501_MvSof-1269-A2-R1_Chr1-3g01692 [Microbotryum saponariae]
MTAAPSLLSRLAPPPRAGAANSSTGAPSEPAGSGAPSPIVQRTRTRGARNRNQNQPQSQSQSQLSSSPPTATQHDSPAPRVKAPPKAPGTAPRPIPAATTKATTDLATSRWAITPPPSPPLSKSPQAKFKPNPDAVAKSCFSSPPSTSHDAKTNEGASSEAINAIDGMLAKLRGLDVSPPSTQPVTALPRKTSTAPPSSVPPKTTNTAPTRQPALGGRSMWAVDSDDDEHAQIPETYKAVVFETNKSTQLEPAVKISTTPKPTPILPTPVVSIPSSTPSTPTAKSSLPIVKLPSSPPVQVQKPPSRSSTPPPPASNPSTSPPATPSSHINWADDDDQDGDLPELEDDWLVSATTTTNTTTLTSNVEIDDLQTRASGLSISPTSAGSASSPPSLESRFVRRGAGGAPNIGGSATGRGGAGSRSGAAPARRTRGIDPTLLKAGSTSPQPASGRTGKGPPTPLLPPSSKSSDHPGSRQAIPPSPRKLRSDRDPPPHAKPTRGAPPPSSIEPPRPLPRTRVAMNPSANLFGRLTGIKKEGAASGTVAGGTGGAGVR